MNNIYLNDTDGRKPNQLTGVNVSESTEELVSIFKDRISPLLSNNPAEIHIDQNISTHIAYIIDLVAKKHKSVSVSVCYNFSITHNHL